MVYREWDTSLLKKVKVNSKVGNERDRGAGRGKRYRQRPMRAEGEENI